MKQASKDHEEILQAAVKDDILMLEHDNVNSIEKIIQIQAAIRGYRDRKLVAELKAKKNGKVNIASDNSRVIEIETKLGPYKPPSDSPGQTTKVKREVRAQAVLSNGARYEGEWNIESGKRDGFGVLIRPDGSKYEGYWRNDLSNGKGRLIHADGDVYEGDWVDDKSHGYGKYVHYDGST